MASGFMGALKAYGKKRAERTKRKYVGPSGGGSSSSDSKSSGGGVASDIIQGAMRRKRAGKNRG